MVTPALFFSVGIMNVCVANVVGIFGEEAGFAPPALQLNICIYWRPFKDVAVIKKWGPGAVGKLPVDFPAGKPFAGGLELYRAVVAAAGFALIDVVYFWIADMVGIHGAEEGSAFFALQFNFCINGRISYYVGVVEKGRPGHLLIPSRKAPVEKLEALQQ